MRPSFYDVAHYVNSIRRRPFNSYEEAEAAYIKHMKRMESRYYCRKYTVYWETLATKGIRVKHPRIYNFGDVKHFLKKRHLWGTQTFGTRGCCDSPDYIGSIEDVTVFYEGNWDYVEIFGLSQYDLERVQNAHY